jgi:hypothetical protein
MIDLKPYVGKSVLVQLRQNLLVLSAVDAEALAPLAARQRNGEETPVAMPIMAGKIVETGSSFAIEYRDHNGSTLRSGINTDIVSTVTEVVEYVAPKKEGPPKTSSVILTGADR